MDTSSTTGHERILIIANPTIGIQKHKRAIVEDIAARLRKKDATVDITYSMEPGMAMKYSSRAALEGYDYVFAAGGDGTVNDVASGLVNRGIPMGIIPLGTGNGLARGLDIPMDQPGYTEVLLNGKKRNIDAGKISSRFFFATAGIGYDAFIAEDYNKMTREKSGISRYVFLGIKHYFTKPTEDITIIIDGGQEVRRKIFGLSVCNMKQYGGGAVIAPQADPGDGKLVAVVIPRINPLKAPFVARKLFDGSVQDIRDIEYYEFETLKIRRSQGGLVQVDGETFQDGPTLTVSVFPDSLEVLIP